MRLQAAFLVLLLTASTATSIVWRDFAGARNGNTEARLLVVTLALVALLSITLLGRIVLKGKERSPARRIRGCE